MLTPQRWHFGDMQGMLALWGQGDFGGSGTLGASGATGGTLGTQWHWEVVALGGTLGIQQGPSGSGGVVALWGHFEVTGG